MTASLSLPPDLLAWIEETAGGRVSQCDRRPGGARKEAWFVDIEGSGGTVDELFLRYDRSGTPTAADPWTLQREGVVYLALQDTDVPVPRVLGVHPEHQAMLSVRLTGENWFSRITDPDEQVRTARHFMDALAALHRLDAATLDLPGFPRPTTVADAVAYELDEFERILDARGGTLDPALLFALDWLRRNIPDHDGPVVLVQGDTGPGNFMYRDGRVVAVVDWELAHLGDPMDDIAWLSLRATQEPFPDLPARLREYETLTGNTIDEGRVHYYRVMAETKLQVMSHRPGATSEGGGGDVGNRLIYGVLHRRLWFEALAACLGLEEPDVERPPAGRDAADHAWLYDAVLTELRDVVVPRTADLLAKTRGKGLARIVKYLAAIDADGPFYEERELDDLTRLLGDPPPSMRAGRVAVADAVRAGKVTERDYLAYLWRRALRDNELLRPASGVLADRHWPALR